MIANIVKFIKSDSFSGVLLIFCTILAIVVVNSSYSDFYHNFFSFKIPLDLSIVNIYKNLSIKDWINDALMAIFFLLVGLEVKKEIIDGELSTKAKMTLPLVAAIGGIIVPALMYSIINFKYEANLAGWAIPTATDIAFAIGILNLFGNKVSKTLKVFLVALAILDDLAAILIITIFYSQDISILYISLAILFTIILLFMNKKGVNILTPYLLIGALLWLMILKSGIHATVAGVVLALVIPSRKNDNNHSLSQILEHKLHPFVNYIIIPIFIFANCGVLLDGFSLDIIFDNLIMGIALGLFLGKQLGVSLAVLIANKLKISPFFKNTSILEFYGVVLLYRYRIYNEFIYW